VVALRLLAAAVGSLALIQLYCVGLALAQVRMSHALALLGALIAALGGGAFALAARRSADPAAGRDPAAFSSGLRWLVGLAVVGLFAWTAWLFGQLLLIAWYRDPLRWDSLWYHVPAIHEWVKHGQVFFYPLDPRLATTPDQVDFAGWLGFPMGVELTGFFVYHLLGTDRLVDATNLWYWIMAIPALVVIARRLGACGPWSWLAGALLFGASEFLRQSATVYVDPAFAATVMASLASGVVFAFDRDRLGWWKALLLGAAIGLMVGSKGPGLPFAAVVLATTFAALWWREGLRSWPRQFRALAPVALVVVAVGGYWSLRNVSQTGNPIYPIQLQLGHKVMARGFDLTGFDSGWVLEGFPVLKPYPAWSRTLVAWLEPDAGFRTDVDPNMFLHSTAGGLGYLWVAGGLPAIVFLWVQALRRRQRERLAVLAYLTITLLVLLQVVPITWQARFTYWVHALGLPALAVVLADAASRFKDRRRHGVTLALGAVVIAIAVGESYRAVQWEWRTGRDPAGAASPHFYSALDLGWPWMLTEPGFRQLLDADRVARSTWKTAGSELLNGVLAMPLAKRSIVVLPPAPTPADLTDLVGRGFRWVLWQTGPGEEVPSALVSGAAQIYPYDAGESRFFAIELASPGY
jgi:Dolichyl-phosphate-mannose-protein mannosyltransferase